MKFKFLCFLFLIITRNLVADKELTESEEMIRILIKYQNNPHKHVPLNAALEANDYQDALFLVEHNANFRQIFHLLGHSYYPLDLIFIDPIELNSAYQLQKKERYKNHKSVLLIKCRNTPIPENHKELVQKLLFALVRKGGLDFYNGGTCRNLDNILYQLILNTWDDIFEVAIKNMRSQSHVKWENLYSKFISDGYIHAIEILDENLTSNTKSLHAPRLNDRFIIAISAKNSIMIKFYIEQGADVNYIDPKTKKRPLELIYSDKKLVELLTAQGATFW